MGKKRLLYASGIGLAAALLLAVIWLPSVWKKEGGEQKAEAGTVQTRTEQSTEEPEPSGADVLKNYDNIGVAVPEGGYLNIREEPEGDARVIGKALDGAGMEIVDDSAAGWYGIDLGGGKTGYVSREFVAAGEEGERLAVQKAEYTAVITADSLRVRENPSQNAAVIYQLQKGDSYKITGERGNWVKVEIREGLEGYVSAEFADGAYRLKEPIEFGLSGLSEERTELLNLAWNYYGGKYVWGGTELGVGVDCSGYVMRLFEKFEIYLHRVSRNQAKDGAEISFEEIRPGDLIFYNMKGGEVDHVALYTGNNKIIHAASEKNGIMVSEWDYLPVVCIRNVFGD